MLQCILTGKAQEAYSASSIAESGVYVTVKAAVMNLCQRHITSILDLGRSWIIRPTMNLPVT